MPASPGPADDNHRLPGAVPAALVIDDDEFYRDLFKLLLDDLGWGVDAAWNGSVGCQKAVTRRYDLAICDILMPGQDGFETIQRLRLAQPDIFIVAVSGGGMLPGDN